MRLAAPVVAGQLSGLMMQITDTLMVGQLGSTQLSAASLGSSIYMLITIIGLGALNAIPALVAEARGALNQNRLKMLYQVSPRVGFIWGVILMSIVLIAVPSLGFLGQPDQEVEMVGPFLFFLALSTPFWFLTTGYKEFLDGMGHTNIGMFFNILALGLNVFFNGLFLFGWFGAPELGLAGSGLATLLARIITWIASKEIIRRLGVTQTYQRSLDYPEIRERKAVIKEMYQLGWPMGLQWFFEVAAFSGAAIMVGWLPEHATQSRAAHAVVLNVCSFTFMVYTGFSVAGGIRVGVALGQGSWEKMRMAGIQALTMGIIVAGFLSILIVSLNQVIGIWYGQDDPIVLGVLSQLLWISALFQIADASQCVGAGVLRGRQDVKIPTWITFIAYWVIWMPLAWFLAFVLGWGIAGIWWADLVGLSFAALVLSHRFFTGTF